MSAQLKDKETKLNVTPSAKLMVALENPKESCLSLHVLVAWKDSGYTITSEVHFLTLCPMICFYY